jgi:hypothetical protein
VGDGPAPFVLAASWGLGAITAGSAPKQGGAGHLKMGAAIISNKALNALSRCFWRHLRAFAFVLPTGRIGS